MIFFPVVAAENRDTSHFFDHHAQGVPGQAETEAPWLPDYPGYRPSQPAVEIHYLETLHSYV